MCTTLSRYDLFNGPASWRASKSDYISQPLSVMAKTFYTIGHSEPKRQPNCPFESPLRQSSLFKCRFIWRKQKRQRSSLPKHLLCWKKVEPFSTMGRHSWQLFKYGLSLKKKNRFSMVVQQAQILLIINSNSKWENIYFVWNPGLWD